ncbi:MAG TPA: TRAP transporter small permease [Tichowtungia sp.]|nr:TRAP transporter small permease [Tichowtungia sp.]
MSKRFRQSALGRVLHFLLDVVELYLPMAAFVMLFLLFVLNVFFRYVLNAPLTWPYELITLSFVWTAIFAATYVRRLGAHVEFTLVYDSLSPKKQRFSRIFANTAVFLTFVIAIPASLDWVLFMDFKATANLKIPFSVGYFPVVPFLVLVAGHSLYDIVVDVRGFIRGDDTTTAENDDQLDEKDIIV